MITLYIFITTKLNPERYTGIKPVHAFGVEIRYAPSATPIPHYSTCLSNLSYNFIKSFPYLLIT